MIKFFTIFLYTFIPVSEQQHLRNSDEVGQFIDSVQKQRLDTPKEYDYEVQNGKLIGNPCTGRRRLMPLEWGYPGDVSTYHHAPRRPVYSPIFLHQLSTELPQPRQHEVSSPDSDQYQHIATTVLKHAITSKTDPDNEAADHLNHSAPSPPQRYNSQDREMVEDPKVNLRSVLGEEIKNITRYEEKSGAISYKSNAESEVVRSSDYTAVINPKDFKHSEHPFFNEAVTFSLIKGSDEYVKDVIDQNKPPLPHQISAGEDPNKSIYESRRSLGRETTEFSAYSTYDNTNINEKAVPQNTGVKIERQEKDDNNVAWNSRRSMGEGAEMQRDILTARAATLTSEPMQEERYQQETKNSRSFGTENHVLKKSGYPVRSQKYFSVYDSSPADGSLFYPTKGAVITPLKESTLAAAESAKVCYACSSINDLSCNFPQRGTTVKYCRPGHQSCITKTVKGILSTDADFIVIRDCGNSCELASIQTLVVDIHSCSVCNGDLCNNKPIVSGAFAFRTFSTLLIFVFTWGVKLTT